MLASTSIGHTLSNYFESIESAVYIFGKVCLFVSVGLTIWIVDLYKEFETTKILSSEVVAPNTEVTQKVTKPITDYSIVSTRNIFGLTASTEGEETKTVEKPTDLSLRLVGASVTNGETPFAIIEDTKKKEQGIFEINDSIFEQAKLIEILAEAVKIEYNGTIETLGIEEAISSGEPTESTGEEGIKSEGNSFKVPEQELTEALANLPKLLSQARAVPYFRNGKSIGMRLFAIRQGSLYEKLGLKNGDILKVINGNNLSDPSQALKLFEMLKSERTIKINVERQGVDKELDYAIE